MKRIIILICVLVIIMPGIIKSQQQKKSQEEMLREITMPWPFDKPTGLRNYAQELVFNRQKGEEKLKEAEMYYNKGLALITNYLPHPEKYDIYERDPYRYDAISPYGLTMREDIAMAEHYFAKAYYIVSKYVEWDPTLTSKPFYKELMRKTFKNLVYAAVYNNNFWRALKYIEEYKKYDPESEFALEWEARIYGCLVEIHEKYDWAYTGKYKVDMIKRKHRALLKEIIDKKYGQKEPADFVRELKIRIYPEYVITTKTVEEKKETKKQTTK